MSQKLDLAGRILDSMNDGNHVDQEELDREAEAVIEAARRGEEWALEEVAA